MRLRGHNTSQSFDACVYHFILLCISSVGSSRSSFILINSACIGSATCQMGTCLNKVDIKQSFSPHQTKQSIFLIFDVIEGFIPH